MKQLYKRRPKTPKEAFIRQRENANKRGISFLFTFDNWVKWWVKNLGPNWFEKRGRLKHQYVMARNGDKGPYVWWNIKCVTTTENTRTKKHDYGTSHPMAKLTEKQVIEIYLSSNEPVKDVAKRYKIAPAYVHKIKSRAIWKTVTSHLGPAPYKQTGRGARLDLRPSP